MSRARGPQSEEQREKTKQDSPKVRMMRALEHLLDDKVSSGGIYLFLGGRCEINVLAPEKW